MNMYRAVLGFRVSGIDVGGSGSENKGHGWFILSTLLSHWEKFKSMDAKRCILALFEMMSWNLKLLRFFLKHGH